MILILKWFGKVVLNRQLKNYERRELKHEVASSSARHELTPHIMRNEILHTNKMTEHQCAYNNYEQYVFITNELKSKYVHAKLNATRGHKVSSCNSRTCNKKLPM